MAGVTSCDFSGDRLTAAAAACISAARAAAAPAVFQMGPLDGTWLARLVAGMLVWEGAFRCARLLVARPVAAPVATAAVSREDRDLWRVLVPSYTVSTLHALLMCWCARAPRQRVAARETGLTSILAPRRGSQHVVQLWRAPEAEKMLIIPGAEFYAQNQAVELSNWCGVRSRVWANPALLRHALCAARATTCGV